MNAANYALETTKVRRIAADPQCDFVWTRHALERMSEWNITATAIRYILTRGQVTLEETAKRDILWRVEGADVDGRRITGVVAVYDQAIKIKVITVFARDEGN